MEGISLEELQLAARNHGMPLEALRYPVTPVGLHYLLIHYDVPVVEPEAWRLTIRGERELELSLDELRARPAVEHDRDDGVRRQRPRPARAAGRSASRGCSRRSARALARHAARAAARGGRRPGRHGRGALHRARPRRRGRGGAGLPARALARGGLARGGAARLRDERRAAAAAARLPAAPGRARLVRHDERQVALADRAARRAVRRLPAVAGVPDAPDRGRRGRAAGPDAAALAARAARDPGVLDPRAHGRGRRACCVEGRAWSGLAPVASVEVSDDGGSTWAAAELEPPARRGPGAASRTAGTHSPASTCSAHARATRPATSSRSSRRGTSAATRTTRCRRCA